MEATYSPNHNNLTPLLIFLLFVSIIAAFVGYNYYQSTQTVQVVLEDFGTLTAEQIRILEVVSGHAFENHRTDWKGLSDCFKRNGSTKSFRTNGFTDSKGKFVNSNLWLCFDGQDWWALVTTPFTRAFNPSARLITFYKISKEIFPTIEDYISYVSLKWGAKIITYTIEATKFLLDPK